MIKGLVTMHWGFNTPQCPIQRRGYLSGRIGLVSESWPGYRWYAFRQPDGAALNDSIKGDPTRAQALKTANKALRQIRRLTKMERCG